MTAFPPSSNLVLRITVSVIAILWIAYGGLMLHHLPEKEIPGLVISIFSFSVAYGIWRLQAWARTATYIAFWLYVVGAHAIMLNPHNAATSEISLTSPAVLYPVIVVGILALHVLGKHRGEFKKS